MALKLNPRKIRKRLVDKNKKIKIVNSKPQIKLIEKVEHRKGEKINVSNMPEMWHSGTRNKKYESEYTKIHLYHWYFIDRKVLELTDYEKYHFNMLYLADFENKFDEIYFSVALNDLNNERYKTFIKQKINEITSGGSAKVFINFIQDSELTGEYETWKRILEMSKNRTDKCLLFYSHSKGVGHQANNVNNTNYWSYLMYNGCLFDGYDTAMEVLKTHATFGSFLHCDEPMCLWFKDGINKLNLTDKPFYPQYSGAFYWVNLEIIKQRFLNISLNELYSVCELNKSKMRYVCETFAPLLFGSMSAYYGYIGSLHTGHPVTNCYEANLLGKQDDFNNCLETLAQKKLNDIKATKKHAVVSCIFGKYELLKEVIQPNPNIDYVMLTDDETMKSKTWRIVNINNDVISKIKNPVSKNIYLRYHIFDYTSADIVLFLDGSVRIKKDIEKVVFEKFENSGKILGKSIHPWQRNVYDELKCWLRGRKNRAVDCQIQYDYYKANKFNSDTLLEGGYTLYRKCPEVMKMCEYCWDLCLKLKNKNFETVLQEQTVETYAIAKTINPDNIFYYNADFRHNGYLHICTHGTLKETPISFDRKYNKAFGKERNVYHIGG